MQEALFSRGNRIIFYFKASVIYTYICLLYVNIIRVVKYLWIRKLSHIEAELKQDDLTEHVYSTESQPSEDYKKHKGRGGKKGKRAGVEKPRVFSRTPGAFTKMKFLPA